MRSTLVLIFILHRDIMKVMLQLDDSSSISILEFLVHYVPYFSTGVHIQDIWKDKF